MLELRNKTPFEAAIAPATDKSLTDYIVVVVKATFDIRNDSHDLPIAEEQAPIVLADEYYEENDNSSIKNVSDTAMVKIGTDVLLKGNAYNPGGKGYVDTSLTVGTIKKDIRVFGDRHWESGLSGWSMSAQKRFEIMPMTYENAFGGKVLVTEQDEVQVKGCEKRNPVGKGFYKGKDGRGLDGFPLPNLEDPRHLISTPRDTPAPSCYAAVAPHWVPRYGFGGTYDKLWEQDRMPFLPLDFDERYFNAAPDRQVSPKPLRGGEAVQYQNLSKESLVRFALPQVSLRLRFSKKQKTADGPGFVMDTVNIDSEKAKLSLTWRTRLPCTRELLYFDWIAVKMG